MMCGLRIGMFLHGDGDVTDLGFGIISGGRCEIICANVDIGGGRVAGSAAFQSLCISRIIIGVIVGITLC